MKTIVAFKGRSGFRTYHPNKPHKWGINVWSLAEARSGYVHNWNVYTGKEIDEDAAGDKTYNVVMKLVRDYLDRGHHIYMDNYFSSPKLFCKLYRNGTGACGTLRINRAGVPDTISKAKMKKGDPIITDTVDNLTFVSWYDKKRVNLVTSVHNTSTFLSRTRSKDSPDGFRTVEKPKAIELYTKYMRGVDLADQNMWYAINVHKSIKWWKKLLFAVLEVSFCNSLVIYKQLNPNLKYTDRNKLCLDVIGDLLEGYERSNTRPGRRSADNDLPTRLTERHFPVWNPKHRTDGRRAYADCRVCSDRTVKRHETLYICNQCLLPMCVTPCFKRYHTLKEYKARCSKEFHEQ